MFLKQRGIYILLILLLAILTVALFSSRIVYFFEFLSSYFNPKNDSGRAEFLKILLSIFGAIGILWGIIISLRRAKALEKGVLNQSEQLELTRKSQIDERFKNAVEHLGSEKEPIILGGIAELYQIAKENTKDYKNIVFNILTSYIRSEAKVGDSIKFSTPIQLIIDYLYKVNESNKNIFFDLKGDLSNTDLEKINFKNLNISNTNFSKCIIPELIDVEFINCDFSSAKFKAYRINNVNFIDSILYKTSFMINKIVDSKFLKAKVANKTNFFLCDFENVIFEDINFFENKLVASNFYKVSFKNCNFLKDSFAISNFFEVSFFDGSLHNIDFRAISIMNSIFGNELFGCNFNGATSQTANSGPQYYDKKIKQRIGKKVDNALKRFLNTQINPLFKNEIGILTEDDVNDLNKQINEIKKS